MACIFNAFLCISDEPLEDDPRFGNQTEWKVSMKDSAAVVPCQTLAWSCCCQLCALYDLRKKALGGSLENYSCCQGYICPSCSRSIPTDSCPDLCLCLEACCFPGCAISATRFLVMDQKNIRSDPCDNRIIRFQNWLVLISCVCNIIAAATDIPALDQAADILHIISNLVSCMVMGCMGAQLYYELDETKGPYAGSGIAPAVQNMK